MLHLKNEMKGFNELMKLEIMKASWYSKNGKNGVKLGMNINSIFQV